MSKLQVVAQKKKVAEKDVAEARKLMEEAKQLVIILQEKQQREPVEKAEIDKAKRVAKQAEKLHNQFKKNSKTTNQSSKNKNLIKQDQARKERCWMQKKSDRSVFQLMPYLRILIPNILKK